MTKITDLRFDSASGSMLNPAVAGSSFTAPAGRFYGKSELACKYFPHLTQKSAWKKLKSLMLDYPTLASIATMPRRTLTTRETALIFETLGLP